MLKSIKIKNFKSHKNTTVKFKDGINVIVGEGQSGKTDIQRALLLLCKNRPGGFSFNSWFSGGKPTEISLFVDDYEIKFKKEKTKITYWLFKDGVECGKWENIGRNAPPDKILSVLSIDDINFQKTADQPFLIASSAGDVMRTINKLTGLNRFVDWINGISKKINATKKEIKFIESEIEDKKKQLKKYVGFEKLKTLISNYEILKLKYKKKKDFENSLYNTYRMIIEIRENMHLFEEFVSKVEIKIKNALKIVDDLKIIERKIKLLVEYLSLKERINKTKDFIKVEKMIDSGIKIEKEIEYKDIIFNKLKMLSHIRSEINDKQNQCNELEDKFSSVLVEYKKCPICLSSINKQQITKIIKSV